MNSFNDNMIIFEAPQMFSVPTSIADKYINQLNDFYYSGADQIIAAKNITRNDINFKCRKIKFGNDVPNYPIEKEKTICLKNYWNVLSDSGDPLINGMIGELSGIKFRRDVAKYENMMNATYKPIRQYIYEYHRLGLDKMSTKQEEGKAAITKSLEYLNVGNLMIKKLKNTSEKH